MAMKAALFCLVLVHASWAFPNGGPIDACVKETPNRPNHSGTYPQNVQSNPYVVEASSDYYGPGAVITLAIYGPKPFKGFFFQARDATTNEWIGAFEKSNEAKAYAECSAITHTHNDPKEGVTLVWHAPKEGSGRVYFIGTVLQDYKTYWSDVVSKVGRQ